MPTDLDDAETGGHLVFPDVLDGRTFRLSEARVYDAEEVREKIDSEDTPLYGRWIPAELNGGGSYLCAVGELIEELQRLEAAPGEEFRITRCEKSGPEETDRYEVNVERTDDVKQGRLK